MHDRFPVIGRAINKVVRYFAADISITAQTSVSQVDNDSIEATERLLKENYDLLEFIIKAGEELATMGNVFIYAVPVIQRSLGCPKCKTVKALSKMYPHVDYEWDGKFKGKCSCGYKGYFTVIEKQIADNKGRKLHFKCMSPYDMLLKYNELTDSYTYLYKMPSHMRTAIVQGDPVYLNNTPMVFLKGAFSGDYIQFPEDKFLHMRVESLASMDRYYKGWGTPMFLSSFNDILRLAYLDKFNESVATDFIAPVRMISPPPQNLMAGNDTLRQNPISGYQVKNFIFQAIKGVRENASQWVVSPFPLNYQMLGGEAKQLAPVELMKWYEERIQQNMGIPVELRQTTFQAVAPSIGLRMFERQWIHYSSSLEYGLIWAADLICSAHMMEKVKVSLDKTSFVEDDMHKQTVLSMAGSGMISQDTVLGTIGLDYKEEQKKTLQEQQFMAEEAAKTQSAQQEMEMTSSVLPPAGSVGVGAAQYNMELVQQQNMPQAPGGAMPPEAAGAPAGGGMPAMPAGLENSRSAGVEQLFQQAQQTAEEIFNIGITQGSGARRSALVKLKAQNPDLHAQVTAILKQRDQDTASQAVAQSKMPQG